MADAKSRLMEFRARKLSHEELFIAADDLSLLDIGEEVQVLVSAPGEPFVASQARVTGSARVFGQRRGLTASGFRLQLVAPDVRFQAVVDGYPAGVREDCGAAAPSRDGRLSQRS